MNNTHEQLVFPTTESFPRTALDVFFHNKHVHEIISDEYSEFAEAYRVAFSISEEVVKILLSSEALGNAAEDVLKGDPLIVTKISMAYENLISRIVSLEDKINVGIDLIFLHGMVGKDNRVNRSRNKKFAKIKKEVVNLKRFDLISIIDAAYEMSQCHVESRNMYVHERPYLNDSLVVQSLYSNALGSRSDFTRTMGIKGGLFKRAFDICFGMWEYSKKAVRIKEEFLSVMIDHVGHEVKFPKYSYLYLDYDECDQ